MQRLTDALQFVRKNIRLVMKTLPVLWRAAPLETAFIVMVLLLQGLIPSFTLFIIREIVDSVALALSSDITLTLSAIAGLVVAWIVAVVLEIILSPWETVMQANLSAKLTAHINIMLMNKANSFPGLTYFEDADFYNEIEVLNREGSYSPLNLLLWLLSTMRYLIIIVSMLVLLATVAWWLPFLLIMATLPQTYITAKMQWQIWEIVVSKSQDVRRMHYFRNIMMTDRYAKEVRIFGLKDFCVTHYRDAFERFYEDTRDIRQKQAMTSTGLVLLSAAGNVIAFLYVVAQTLAGVISIGSVIVFVQALAYVQQTMSRLGESISGLLETLLYMEKFFIFMEREPALKVNQPGLPVAAAQSGIRFENVSFSYPDGRKALDSVSLSIAPGEVVAIVGENGAGKTTLVKLLARFYDPESGQILIDDTPLNSLNLTDWRQKLAVVFQDFNRFALPVQDSIRIGDLHAANGVQHAAEQSGFSEVAARLPDAYETQLGKPFGGTELSGGEWQKLALARAFMRRQDAQLLILDEPTASLDPRSEYEIYKRFAGLSENKTTLLITHRLASIHMADRIIVMKQGRIVEQGTHQELLLQNGEYASLWQMQSEKYQNV
jgi:ATP-binding cassette subfamily B protein